MEPKAEDRIIALLRSASAPMSLAEISKTVDLSPPATHRQLQLLVDDELVKRQGRGRATRYALRDAAKIAWTKAKTETSPAIALRWERHGPFDWRFPLASRVRDEWAYVALLHFLEKCQEAGVMTPWLVDYLDPRSDYNDIWAGLNRKERDRRRRDPANHGRVHVYAYGSAVSGQARSDSDLDLVLVPDLARNAVPDFPFRGQVEAIVGPLNLGSPRRLDVRVFGEDEFFDGLVAMHERVRRSILRTGITVFSNHPEPRYLEADRDGLEVALAEWTNSRS